MTELTRDKIELLVNKHGLTLAMLRYWENLADHTQQFFKEAAEQPLKRLRTGTNAETPIYSGEDALLATAVDLAYRTEALRKKDAHSPNPTGPEDIPQTHKDPRRTAEGLLKTKPGHTYQKYLEKQWAAFGAAPGWKASKGKFTQAVRSMLRNFPYLYTATRTMEPEIEVIAFLSPHLGMKVMVHFPHGESLPFDTAQDAMHYVDQVEHELGIHQPGLSPPTATAR